MTSPFEKDPPSGFSGPTALPRDGSQGQRWQQANRAWWESHPMRYDWGQGIAQEPFSSAFYEEIDRRFFESLQPYMPWKEIPFDLLIDYHSLGRQDVLEIGVGAGSQAQVLARHARSLTGIDITENAVELTRRRFQGAGMEASILRMDAERMEFADESFDFIWSWGVIHHSANTRQVLLEMRRVLRRGGGAIVMVYHRNWWNYYIGAGLCEGILRGDLARTRSLHKTMQNKWDGALARFYTRAEWQSLVADLFNVEKTMIFGQKSEVFPLRVEPLRRIVVSMLPVRLCRFLTNDCSLGSFLVSFLRRPG